MTCSACGDEKPLGPDGVCEWRAGCEHRQMQAAVAEARFDADYRHHFDLYPCGHTGADHEDQWRQIAATTPFRVPPAIAAWIDRSVQEMNDLARDIPGWDDEHDDEPG